MTVSPNTILINGLSTKTFLSEQDREALNGLQIDAFDIRRGQDILREGERPVRSALLLSGLACSYKMLQNGKRQITAFYHPGDVPDLQSLHLQVADNSILALSDARFGAIQHRDLEELCADSPSVTKALWRTTLVDASIYREWATNLGQRDAVSRMAHLFCETLTKQQVIYGASSQSCSFPVTQADLADALGLSVVHVNRSLMELRSTGSLSFERGQLTACNWSLLQKQAQFDPSYLHLRLDERSPHKLI